jgi:hypothetical protein
MGKSLAIALCLLTVAEAARGAVILNEVMANPAGTEADREWIELYNTSPTDGEDLGGWQLTDTEGAFTLPAVWIPAGGYLLLGRNGDVTLNGAVALHLVYGSTLQLANSGDDLSLLRADGSLADTMAYTGTTNGRSLERIDPRAGGGDAANWADALTPWDGGDYGTPGAANSNLLAVPESTALSLVLPATVVALLGQRHRRGAR